MVGSQVQNTELHEDAPKKVASDGLAFYPRAIQEELGSAVEHEIRPCTANPVGQSHRRVMPYALAGPNIALSGYIWVMRYRRTL